MDLNKKVNYYYCNQLLKVGMKFNFIYDFVYGTDDYKVITFDLQKEKDIVKAYNISCNINKPKYVIEKREVDLKDKLKNLEEGIHLYNAYSILKKKYLRQIALILDQQYDNHIKECSKLYICHPDYKSSLICTNLTPPTKEQFKEIGHFRTLKDIQFAEALADKILYKFHGLSR